ncbi:di-trans,poly-cis-decaprenylcistransferase [Candidatus Woesearchaeota archaeon]|nr:di-trans,poly-cis-decaprenylcistransferase [Candidatus Woesearchaeota archaeon]
MSVPKHVGIILDGNRRFAKRLMLKPWKGHEWGARKVEKLFEWAKELEIKELTLYAFSIENFDRPKEEFDYLMTLFYKEFEKLVSDEKKLSENKIKFRFIGRINMFPQEVREQMRLLMDKTKDFNDYIVNFAMAYGGRAEVIDATKKIAEQVKSGKLDVDAINDEVFKKNLYMSDEPDLIIRTSGERRTSGFLLYQADYAELAFVDKFWPEFEKEDFVKIIEDYSKRERRFGK